MLNADFLFECLPLKQKYDVSFRLLLRFKEHIQTTKEDYLKLEELHYKQRRSKPPGGGFQEQSESNIPIAVQYCGPQVFHEKCDKKGPTMLLVKLKDGHIFGGYNPLHWESRFGYQKTSDSFLFSVTDGKGRRPQKCPIKLSKSKFAIKQNEQQYSPGFGEANTADLFIAFKNLENSYSMLGNVYKCPTSYKDSAETFLAGSKTDWDIEEVEVWELN